MALNNIPLSFGVKRAAGRNVRRFFVLRAVKKQIAGELHVSENTVKTHVKHIYEKLGVCGREEIQVLLS